MQLREGSPEGKQRVGRYLTHLPDAYMKEVAAAQILATSAISYLTKEELAALWETAVRLNGGTPG